MIDSLLLSYLLVFSETGSLSKSAELLHLSQPSLSKAMQKLEAELGLTIFERTGNRIFLNENGKALLTDAYDIVTMIHRMEDKAKNLSEKVNTLSIGMSAPGPLFRYPSLFAGNEKRQKVSHVIEKEDNLLKGLIDNTYDLIFINKSIEGENLVSIPVMKEHLYVSLPKTHFLAKMKEGITFKEADGQTFLVVSDTGIWMDILRHHMTKSRFLLQDDLMVLREIAESSSIPSFVTDITMNQHSIKNRVAIPFLDEDATVSFFAVTKKNRASLLNEIR